MPQALLIGGAVVSAVGAIRAGNAAKNQADFQSKVAQQQATRERQKASAAEEDFRRSSSRRAAASRAVGAASGVEIDTGSSLLVAEDFAGETELSALRIEQGGEDTARRLEQESSLLTAKGKSARTAGFFRAGSSLLTGIGMARKEIK